MRTPAPVRPLDGGLLWSGLVAGLAYAVIVIVGGAVTSGYDHISQPVSSLYQAGSANGAGIALAFVAYNALAAAFGIAVARLAVRTGGPKARAGIGAGIVLILTGIAGAIDDYFPQDPIGSPVTTIGSLHIAFAGIASLTTLVAIALAVVWLLAQPGSRRFARYSLLAFILILASGPVTAVQTANLSPQMGLFERVTIFTFIVWMAGFSVFLARGHVAATVPEPIAASAAL